jgi:hypothetical protein
MRLLKGMIPKSGKRFSDQIMLPHNVSKPRPFPGKWKPV